MISVQYFVNLGGDVAVTMSDVKIVQDFNGFQATFKIQNFITFISG